MPPKPPTLVSKASIPRRSPPPPFRALRTAQPRSQPISHPSSNTKPSPQYTSSPPPHPPFPPRTYALSWAKYTATLCFFAGATMVFIRDYIFSFDRVNGCSMSPTLSPGAFERGETERILLLRGPKVLKELKRGDVVTFWKPHKPGEVSIKRVIALAGDTVYPIRGYATKLASYTGKHLRINDGLPTNEDVAELAAREQEVEIGKVVVPHGHVWVEGDNSQKSLDSNDFGPVSMALIDGKAAKVWRCGWFRDIEDKRRKKGQRTRIVQGESVIPDVYLE